MLSIGTQVADPRLRTTVLRAGDQIDHYLIDSVAARSGMASIFRATDMLTGLPVAIKVPHPEMESDPTFLARFEREQAIGADLDHTGIMKVFRDDERSHLYMVMEWVEGRELRKLLIEQKKLSTERAITIMAAVCRALDYAHACGVVHRDLKPENIMVDRDDRAKLIDFGIAGRAGARQLTFGAMSQLMGTPDYVSPEQVNGKPGDARSDIYALAVVLYEMVTGTTPFRGPNPFAVMNDRLLNNPIPPRELNPEVSPQLQEVIYRAMRRDPADRYATAGAFAWDLEHLDLVDPHDRLELRNWDWRRRHWLKSALLYTALALIPIGIFALLLYVAHSSPSSAAALHHR
jgi:serine/threonine protein kinase